MLNKGDLVIIHYPDPYYLGHLGIVHYKEPYRSDNAWAVEMGNGLSTFLYENLEVIDHGYETTDFSVPFEVVAEVIENSL